MTEESRISAVDEHIRKLVSERAESFSLPQEFYSDPEIYLRDIERIHMRHWLCVGHESRIPKVGDFFVYELAGESVIIIRGKDGEVRALLNVCRHRGSQVLWEKQGNAKALVCPYHAWGYSLEGKLQAARHLASNVDREKLGLKKLHICIVEQVIFINFSETPSLFTEAASVVTNSLGRYGWGAAKVAHRALYSVDANWKLATENYLECYHCGPAHPEFAKIHATEAREHPDIDALRARIDQRAAELGIEFSQSLQWRRSFGEDQENATCFHDAFYGDAVSGSQDGQSVAPLMGDFSQYDGGYTYVKIGPASFFLAYPDHGVMYLFMPRGIQSTDMEIIWLVREDAREGEDYDLKRLIWLWDVTTIADKGIIDHNQLGVNSRFYQPGPYTEMEEGTDLFVNWYLQELAPD